MPRKRATKPVTTLWRLRWNDDRLSCVVYRGDDGLQLRLESKKAVIFSQPFEMQPRSLARLRTLRESLKRRGWRETEKPGI